MVISPQFPVNLTEHCGTKHIQQKTYICFVGRSRGSVNWFATECPLLAMVFLSIRDYNLSRGLINGRWSSEIAQRLCNRRVPGPGAGTLPNTLRRIPTHGYMQRETYIGHKNAQTTFSFWGEHFCRRVWGISLMRKKVPPSACLTVGVGSKAIWVMPK